MAEPKEQQKAMRVDGSLVRELAELLSANDLTEIEVEDGDSFEIVHFVGGG
jgi:acetyl-CoA carboxylase biotin carboxyl carrier protein